ncbi:MAG TPA: DUF1259 domain-containing protein, partial [Bacillales bacterium]
KVHTHEFDVTGLCDKFNDLLGGTIHTVENGICTVMGLRTEINAVVLGRKARSFLVLTKMFAFESMTRDGFALCSGETVILQEEINPFITRLREHGIIVTAIHNHWLFEDPRLMYIHFESVDRPIPFAHKVREALSVFGGK